MGLFFQFQQIEGDFENGGIEDNLDRSLLYKVTCPSGTDCLCALADFVMLENTWVGMMCIPSWVICLWLRCSQVKVVIHETHAEMSKREVRELLLGRK